MSFCAIPQQKVLKLAGVLEGLLRPVARGALGRVGRQRAEGQLLPRHQGPGPQSRARQGMDRVDRRCHKSIFRD